MTKADIGLGLFWVAVIIGAIGLAIIAEPKDNEYPADETKAFLVYHAKRAIREPGPLPEVKDLWNSPIRFERHEHNGETVCEARSCGRDGDFGTPDDIVVIETAKREDAIAEWVSSSAAFSDAGNSGKVE